MIAVTKLIDLLDKPGLLYWSNRLGLNGINLKDYYIKTSTEGGNKHNDIEQYLKYGKKFNGSEKLDLVLKDFNVVGVESQKDNGYLTGRIDLILEKKGLTYIVDFKRNKNIYLKTKLQLSCYKHMINADKVCYINYDDFNLIELDIDTKKYYEIIKRLYQIHLLLNELNEKL